MQGINKILAVLLLLALPSFAAAANFPKPTGFVNDFAGVINQSEKTQLTNIITQFEKETGNEIAVATVPSLGGEPIENYAVGMFKEWGIGKKGKDTGLLLLVAPTDRRVRIEVGYGLEPYINDALAGRIIRDTMVPHFKDGDFSGGILNGVVELTTVIAKKTEVKFDPIAAGQISSSDIKIYHLGEASAKKQEAPLIVKILQIIFVIVVVIIFIKNPWAALFILSSVGGGGRGGSFRGGFGGGFGGFGGGSSGGGGASSSW